MRGRDSRNVSKAAKPKELQKNKEMKKKQKNEELPSNCGKTTCAYGNNAKQIEEIQKLRGEDNTLTLLIISTIDLFIRFIVGQGRERDIV